MVPPCPVARTMMQSRCVSGEIRTRAKTWPSSLRTALTTRTDNVLRNASQVLIAVATVARRVKRAMTLEIIGFLSGSSGAMCPAPEKAEAA
jgi:hypothetical protein